MSKVNFPAPFNLRLNDRHSRSNWFFKTIGTPQVEWLTSEQFSVVLNAEGRKIGDFDEQRDWSGGRGGERLSDDPTKYKDAWNACTWIKGHIIPSLQQNISTGYRDAEQALPGSVSWRGVFGSTRYISRTVVASASSNRAHIWFWIRRVGSPGTLTVEWQDNSGGKPDGTANKSATVTTSAVTDVLSELHDFSFTAEAVTSGTTYHIVAYGASTDDDKNHWEVGVDASAGAGFYKSSQFAGDGTATDFSVYYRLTGAEVDRRWWFFWQGANFCAVSNEATATLLKWDETNDDWDVVAAGTHGLGQVTGRPVEVNGFVYFPQGDSVAIRTWDGTNWDAQTVGSGQGCAVGLATSYSEQDNAAQIVRYNNALVSGGTTTGLAVSVSRAPAVAAYTTDLAFKASTPIGNKSTTITGLLSVQNGVWVFKSDEAGSWINDKYTALDFGMKDTPSSTNGQASVSWNNFVYFNWLFSDERVYSGTVDDIGQGFRKAPLPYGRDAVTANYCRYIGSLFMAKDAGTSGTSSVLLYDGLNEHEFARAWASGRRIRDVKMQPVSGARTRLWYDCGGDLVWVTMPLNKSNPLHDTGLTYQHEFAVESSEIDMGTASKLPKFIKDITATTKNLDGKGIYIDVDYQLDDNIGKTGFENWVNTGEAFLISPEDKIDVDEGNLRKFAYRLRAHTDDYATPPDVRGIVPNGFARSEMRKIISVECDVRDVQVNGKKQTAREITNWLEEASASAYLVEIRSAFEQIDDYLCLIGPPNLITRRATPEADTISLNLVVL